MNKKRLFIAGAGGAGIEIESFLSSISESKRDFELIGFLDDTLSPLKDIRSDYKVVGGIFDYKFGRNDWVILSIVNSEGKKKIYSALKDKVNFYTYVDSSTFTGKFSDIGEGSIICPQCLISTNVTIGKFVFVNSASQIGHSSKINDFSSLMSNVNIGGNCKIGNSVFFGTGSIVIPGKSICDNTIIGAGAVVIRDIKSPATYFGNPAIKL
jgi:sugar O-acyltransferase (sialic acid O-acetyltransferase NeuD family)